MNFLHYLDSLQKRRLMTCPPRCDSMLPASPSSFVLFAKPDPLGFIAAESTKRAGKVRDIEARLIFSSLFFANSASRRNSRDSPGVWGARNRPRPGIFPGLLFARVCTSATASRCGRGCDTGSLPRRAAPGSSPTIQGPLSCATPATPGRMPAPTSPAL